MGIIIGPQPVGMLRVDLSFKRRILVWVERGFRKRVWINSLVMENTKCFCYDLSAQVPRIVWEIVRVFETVEAPSGRPRSRENARCNYHLYANRMQPAWPFEKAFSSVMHNICLNLLLVDTNYIRSAMHMSQKITIARTQLNIVIIHRKLLRTPLLFLSLLNVSLLRKRERFPPSYHRSDFYEYVHSTY